MRNLVRLHFRKLKIQFPKLLKKSVYLLLSLLFLILTILILVRTLQLIPHQSIYKNGSSVGKPELPLVITFDNSIISKSNSSTLAKNKKRFRKRWKRREIRSWIRNLFLNRKSEKSPPPRKGRKKINRGKQVEGGSVRFSRSIWSSCPQVSGSSGIPNNGLGIPAILAITILAFVFLSFSVFTLFLAYLVFNLLQFLPGRVVKIRKQSRSLQEDYMSVLISRVLSSIDPATDYF